MNAIEVEQLRKEFKVHKSRSGLVGAFRDLWTRRYATIRAVDGISFAVRQGEIVGYIGENGAGKSTTIKMLTGILTPTSGRIVVNGMNPHKEREKFVRTIGVVFGQRSQLWWDIAVQESFRLLKKVYRVPDEQYRRHMGEVIEMLDIGPLLDKPVRKLSLGQRMRCEIAAALIHNPPLLFLDEPTIGLDVLVKLNIRQFLKQLSERYGTTILLTTHDMSDIEALCERVIMLDEGKIIYDGSLGQLKEKWGQGKRISFTFVEEAPLVALQELTTGLDVNWKQGEQPNVWVAHVPSGGVPEVVSRVAARYPLQDIHIHEVPTEEIIRNIYQEGAANG
ncbi:ATP-binding cassette domain-containing protein [Geobacillus stearothermophilus]|uniref:ABC transporter ATP-binding protein n=1 Tax=Geobacillus stearothermophilus TaxID=1422 RepID=UPI002E203E19|nr:ATP-binding cassette domain-containing protein [Geobacillus stearothermophilus]MED5042844.1 ATP-binding cassette domain-containing protein [Geobacillus stearothermophilus]